MFHKTLCQNGVWAFSQCWIYLGFSLCCHKLGKDLERISLKENPLPLLCFLLKTLCFIHSIHCSPIYGFNTYSPTGKALWAELKR